MRTVLSRAGGTGPFTDYFIPSLILLVLVGGSLLVAAVAVLPDERARRGLQMLGLVLVNGAAQRL
jgi:hypothetical protein